MKDVSILIVHFNTPGLLRQTIKGIQNATHVSTCEILVVDNNPEIRVHEMLRTEFPEVRVIVSETNLGFGRGMNRALELARGRYFFVFNPDIATFDHQIDTLVRFMDAHADVGMVGPKLLNPDRSLQYSCYTFMDLWVIPFRRVPILRSFSFAKRHVEAYLMTSHDHSKTCDVDYLLGAAMLVRREAYQEVGGFDPAFFVYFEDQDWCRRFWKANWRVVHHPEAWFVHYHRRETAEGGFIKQLRNPLTRIQIQSALYYHRKYKGQPNPRTCARLNISSDRRTQTSS